MESISLKLHWTQEGRIAELLKYEEARVIRRCNILSCLHHGMTSGMVSKVLHVDPKTVRNIAHTFNEKGLDAALYDDQRSGRPIDIDDNDRSRIVAMVCSDPPSGYYRWTLDLIVEETTKRMNQTVSREQIRLILHEHDLKPWQEKMWCIEELSEEYIERMEDVLDVYERPQDPEFPVICMDEKPVALIGDTRERVPAAEGSVRKIDYEYTRNGSVNVFMAVEPKAGRYLTKVTENRKATEFAHFLMDLSEEYKAAKKIILIMDNLSTHSLKSLTTALGEAEGKRLWERFEVHFTPKHASWLNQAEIAIGMYSRQSLGDGRVGDIKYLKAQTSAWTKRTKKKEIKIQWRFTTSKARTSFGYSLRKSA